MNENLKPISDAMSQWERECLQPTLERRPERKEEFRSMSGEFPVNRLYTPLDIEGHDYLEKIGFPGSYPFTRGIHPAMYRGQLWGMVQYSGFGTPEQTNQRYKYLFSIGTNRLSMAFDLPHQIGHDSDHPLAKDEVGRVGVSVNTLRDMEILFDGIPMDKTTTSMTVNAQSAVTLAMYIAAAEKQGVAPHQLSGTIQNDIIKEYAARGTYIFPPEPSLRLITDVVSYCARNIPRWNAISVTGYHFREAGATACQEIGFMLADAIEYCRAITRRTGLVFDEFAPRITFLLTSHSDFFEEVAKFRAVRRMWAKIAREWFGAQKPASMMFKFLAGYAGATYTAQQALNNVVRGALQTFAAVLGGAQICYPAAYDEALGLQTEESVKLSQRTVHIIAEETGVTNTVDPMGGSYYLESLTDRIEERTWEIIHTIESMGGALEAVKKGYYQEEIRKSAYEYQRKIDNGELVVVGVNKYAEEEQIPYTGHVVDPEVERLQIQRLHQVRQERDNLTAQKCLDELRRVAGSDENLMPHILDAVRAYCSIGEICQVLREVFGEYEPGGLF